MSAESPVDLLRRAAETLWPASESALPPGISAVVYDYLVECADAIERGSTPQGLAEAEEVLALAEQPPRPQSKRAREWAKDMPQRLVQAAQQVLPAAYDQSCGVTAAMLARTASSTPEDWEVEARAVVPAVLRELTRADCPRTITALDIRFWANEAAKDGGAEE